MKPNSTALLRTCAATLAAFTMLRTMHGQSTPPAADEKKADTIVMEAFVTTGSNIKRLDQENTLPVTVFSMAQLETRDSATPMDLLIGIPEITNIPANETSTNAVAARGDNANIALRGLGAANTLVILNGRRTPFHPFNTSSVNVNTLPTFGLQQLEVLRDGASAIYGSDAVAGVVNYVTEKKPQGSRISNRFGFTQHGGGMDEKLDIGYGTTFAEGKGSYVMSYSGYYRDAIYLREREYSSSSNRLKYARAPWNVVGQTAYDGRTSVGVWTQFIPGTTTSNTATRFFYPTSGNPADTPSINTTAIPRGPLFADYNQFVTGQPQSWRNNLYNRVEYDLTPSVRMFAEGSFYLSRSRTGRQPITLNASDNRVILSADNPYNPLGSRFYHTAGAANADGTARLVGTPQTATIASVLLSDGGPEVIEAIDSVYRILVGAGGQIGKTSWTWESAAMVGGVYANDQSKNAVRDSYLRGAALRTNASAWNPFGWTFKVQNGAVVADKPYVNPQSVRDYYTISANRFGHSKLASYDFHLGGNVVNLWAGPIAGSIGGEWRYEFKEDHKDPFVNVNGPGAIGGDGLPLDPLNNDVMVTSPKFDYAAGRVIASGYAETVVPLAKAHNQIPFVQSATLNASVRYEHYSDFGSTTKPKFGGDWRPTSWLLMRASLNKGFRAPDLANLYQPASFSVASPPGTRDSVRNDFFNAAGLGNDVQLLTKTYSLPSPNLQPEISEGRSVGIAVDIPQIKGLSFTVDYWEITQNNLIVSQTTTAGLDAALLRAYTQSELAAGKSITSINVGSRASPDEPASNYKGDPYRLRNPVAPEDIAKFQQAYARLPQAQWIAPLGTPVGTITQFVNSTGRNFTNGFDFSVSYNLPKTSIGQFRLSTEWSEFLNKYTKTSPGNPKNDEINSMLTPKWKSSATIQWRNGPWDAGLNMAYQTAARTGVTATAAQYTALNAPGYIKPVTVYASTGIGTVNYYERGEDQLQLNASLSYRFGPQAPKWIRRTSIRIGVNNVLDADPAPANSNSTGYNGGSGTSMWVGRAFSLTTTKNF